MAEATAGAGRQQGQQSGEQSDKGGTGGAGGAGGAAAGGAGAAAPWHGIVDPEAAAYVTNKGWANPADMLRSYQGAEKLIGRDPSTLLVVPRHDDSAGLRAVYTKLGMPETADKYDLDAPKDLALDPTYMAWAKTTFHKVGLTAAQAKALSAEHNAYIQNSTAQQVKDYAVSVAADKTTLMAEWRGGYERMMNSAQLAAKALGFTPAMIDAMETKLGYAGTMKAFAEMGKKLGEDSFAGGGDKNNRFSNTMTPAEAKSEWEAMKMNPDQIKALQDPMHPGNTAAKEKQKKLFSIIYPTG